jgi:hypothetical protein
MRLALTAVFVLSATVAAQSPDTAECAPGFVVASGVLSQADHEALEGFGNINEFSFSMRPKSPLYLRVLELRGQAVEVVIRPLKPRELERIR